MNGEAVCTQEAVVVEKSFAGGQLRILFGLPDGQTLTASRYGIDMICSRDRRYGSAGRSPRSKGNR